MIKYLFILMITAVLIALTGCDMLKKDDPEPEPESEPSLEVTPANISAAVSAGTYAIAVESNVAWTATVTVDTDEWWCRLSDDSATGNGTVTVIVDENLYTDTRTATVTITTDGSLTSTVIVTQAATAPFITVSENTVEVDYGDGLYQVAVTYNTSFEASINEEATEWCTVSPASLDLPGPGIFMTGLDINVTENTPTAPRSATLTITAGTLTCEVYITQEAAIPYLILPYTSSIYPSIGGHYNVRINSNIPWTATLNDEATEWCTISPTSFSGTERLVDAGIRMTENPVNASRTATIHFTADTIIRTLTVIQEGTPPTPPHAASTQTWVFDGFSVWSDAIQIPECNKTDFPNSRTEPQCRNYYQSISNRTFYYYNWPYVKQHEESLCPPPWRVPTASDLFSLHGRDLSPMLGDGYGGYINAETNLAMFNRYETDLWSITQSENYWPFSDEEDAANTAVRLKFATGFGGDAIGSQDKSDGLQVRCVR